MVYAGSSGVGAQELSRVIGFVPQDDPQDVLFPGMKLYANLPPTITLKIANGLWCDSSTRLRPTFEAKIKDLFHPEIQAGDLSTRETMKAINDWVAKATEGRIAGLLQPPPKPPLVLIDAVYFKGAWEKPFSCSSKFRQSIPPAKEWALRGHHDETESGSVLFSHRRLSSHQASLRRWYLGNGADFTRQSNRSGGARAKASHRLLERDPRRVF